MKPHNRIKEKAAQWWIDCVRWSTASVFIPGVCLQSGRSLEWIVQMHSSCLCMYFIFRYDFHSFISDSFQAFQHIFTSLSSVKKEPKGTRSGNAHIHGMGSVTLPSIAYVATQVCEVGSLHQLKYIFWPPSQIGSLQPIFISRIFQDWHHHQFREVLQLHCWTIWWFRRTRGGERTPCVVEPVCLHCIWKCFID